MAESMAADFVSTLGDSYDDGGEALSNPAKHKECASCAVALKQIEDAVNALLDTRLKGPPRFRINRAGESLYMEVFLNVDTDCI